MNSGNGPASVSRRIIAVLRVFAEGERTLSIQEIAAQLDLAPSSVHRLLAGLVEENIVERAARRRYCVGREFGRIGALASRKISIRRLARPMLQQLLAATGETSMLGTLMPQSSELIVADKLESVHALRYKVLLHERRPLLWGASGKSVLAWLDPDHVARALACGSNAPGNGDMAPTATALGKILLDIRRDGYAISRGELVLGAVDIAAPVFDADDRVVGNLAVMIPDIRLSRRDEHRVVQIVLGEAHKLSSALGWQGAAGPRGRQRYLD